MNSQFTLLQLVLAGLCGWLLGSRNSRTRIPAAVFSLGMALILLFLQQSPLAYYLPVAVFGALWLIGMGLLGTWVLLYRGELQLRELGVLWLALAVGMMLGSGYLWEGIVSSFVGYFLMEPSTETQ